MNAPRVTAAFVLGCASLGTFASGSAGAPPDPARHLRGLAATMVVLDRDAGTWTRLDAERATERFAPCSTFKIPNSLIGLEAGAVSREDSLIRWDPERDPRQEWWPKSWARDHDLPSAIRNSVVWYYQELARRVGAERMGAELERIGYGNEDISGGIDRFWLSSTLRISANEQVDFLRRLHAGELGFSESNVAFVEDALVLERAGERVWTGKTGACNLDDGRFIGWLVGWVEGPDDVWLYALNLEGDTFADVAEKRKQIARAVLADLGVLP